MTDRDEKGQRRIEETREKKKRQFEIEKVASQPRVRQWTNDATRAAWLARETPVSSLSLASTEACLARGSTPEASLWGHARSTWPCQPYPETRFANCVVVSCPIFTSILERVQRRFRRSSPSLRAARNRSSDRIHTPAVPEAWEALGTLLIHAFFNGVARSKLKAHVVLFFNSICLALYSSGWKVSCSGCCYRAAPRSGNRLWHARIERSSYSNHRIVRLRQRYILYYRWSNDSLKYFSRRIFPCYIYESLFPASKRRLGGILSLSQNLPTTDSCKCHARCLLHGDAEVAGRREEDEVVTWTQF